MTQLEIAAKGNISPEMEKVAQVEGLDVEVHSPADSQRYGGDSG